MASVSYRNLNPRKFTLSMATGIGPLSLYICGANMPCHSLSCPHLKLLIALKFSLQLWYFHSQSIAVEIVITYLDIKCCHGILDFKQK